MKTVVCIKQVPDTTDVRIDPKTNTLVREGVPSIINPFDMYAIEEAVRLKEEHGGETVVITMGPPQAEAALREAVGLGIDAAVLLCDRAFAGADTLATSYTVSMGLRRIGDFDLILCGKQAADGDTAQVGPGIAVHLDIPQVTYVKKIEAIENGRIKVHRMTEEGYDVVSSSMPVLLTVVKEINEPRLPSLKGKMRAKKAEITVWTAADIGVDESKIGLDGSPTFVEKVFAPPERKGGKVLTGDVPDIVEELLKELEEKKIL